MNLPKLSFTARKIHRLSLIFVVVLGLLQMVTGITMKYPTIFSFFDQGFVRLLHFTLADWFALFFGIQMLTGLIMYFIPILIRRMQQKPPPPPSV